MMRPLDIAAVFSICCLAFAAGNIQFGEKYVFLHNTDSLSSKDALSLLVLSWPENREQRSDIEECVTVSDQEFVRDVYRSSNNPRIYKITSNELENLRKDCHEFSQDLSQRRRRRSLGNERLYRVDDNKVDDDSSGGSFMIWPNTKWCGAGDIAENDEDLGEYADEDKCCRAHDKCDDIILKGESNHNLTNDSSFTKLSCSCDQEFRDCLERVGSFTANSIGSLYFSMLGRECFEEDYPLSDKCKEYSFMNIMCKEYEKDTTAAKVYQWKTPESYSINYFSF